MDLDRGKYLAKSRFTYQPVILGAKISGHRGYFLTNDGIDLNQALITYALDFLRKRAFKKIQPPFMMNKAQMAKTAQLDQFDEELYKVLASVSSLCSISILSGYRLRGRKVLNCNL